VKEEIRTFVNYRMERSRESLEEAKILLEKGYINTYVNRLYYACFYSVSALLLTKNYAASKHSGIKALFEQYFVKVGVIEKDYAALYNKLYRNRQKGDYADLVRFDINEVRPWFDETQKFVEVIEEILKKELGN
jgi:uncharacterized protein